MSNIAQEQAISNLSGIASGGMTATDSLAQLAPIFHTLKEAVPKLPQLPTAGGAPGQPTPGFEAGSLSSADPLERSAVKMAAKYLGIKYAWGGTSAATGFDCSGLLVSVWKQLGVNIPRTTYDQWSAGKAVSGPLKPGDAVFFRGSDSRNGLPGHVGMYIGNGKMIVAPRTGSVVQIQTVAGQGDYMGARRFG